MAYWFLNKQTKEPRIFGSLPVMCEEITELDKQSLEYHFSRLKKEEFENDTYRIVKRNLERGGKKNKIKRLEARNFYTARN